VLANLQKGRSALETGNAAQAEQDFRRALEYPTNLGVGKPDRPADAQPLYWLGVALSAEGKTDAAHAAWNQAAEEPAGDRMIARVYRAAALLRLGQTEEGQRLMNQAIARTEPQDAGAAEFYAAGLAQDLSGNKAEARRDFQHTLEMNRSYWQARVELERIPAR
jgi:tetratricopeptide (TPR) repeat protein